MKSDPISIEQTFPVPAEAVWQAITDKNKMKEWYFDIPDFKPEVGLSFQFLAGTEEKKFLHLCRITSVEPRKKIAYTWRYEGEPGDTLVTFELLPEGNNCRLRLTHEGLENFRADNIDLKRENFVEGWTHIIGKSLPAFLEKNKK